MRVYRIEAIEMIEMYLKADIDLASDRGKMTHTVVITAWRTLNRVIFSLGSPVTSLDTPN